MNVGLIIVVTNSVFVILFFFLLHRCIWLRAKRQSLPFPGQPLSPVPVPQPPVQPHHIRLSHRAPEL